MRNWIAKNGLPSVFWCTRCASGSAAVWCTVERVRHELRHGGAGERGEHNVVHCRLRLPNGRERLHEWVRRADLVVAKGPDHEQVLDVRMGHEVFDELERRRVEPLEIVEKEGERMFLPSKRAQEGSETPYESGAPLPVAAAPAWVAARQ